LKFGNGAFEPKIVPTPNLPYNSSFLQKVTFDALLNKKFVESN
jgi:hypothetical protein